MDIMGVNRFDTLAIGEGVSKIGKAKNGGVD